MNKKNGIQGLEEWGARARKAIYKGKKKASLPHPKFSFSPNESFHVLQRKAFTCCKGKLSHAVKKAFTTASESFHDGT